MTTPYTYRIFCKSTKQYYYGVRFAKDCDPSDLFVTYFTSSKAVKKLIDLYGISDFEVQIRRTFLTKDDAWSWEIRVNRWTMKWDNYLNKHSNGNFLLSTSERHSVGVKAGNKCRDMKLGFHKFTPEERVEIAKKSSIKATETARKNGTGFFGMTLASRQEIGYRCKDEQLGFHSKESKEKQRIRAKMPWWNNGSIVIKADTCPGTNWTQGRLTKGRHWWNNGITEIMSISAPDATWNNGRLK